MTQVSTLPPTNMEESVAMIDHPSARVTRVCQGHQGLSGSPGSARVTRVCQGPSSSPCFGLLAQGAQDAHLGSADRAKGPGNICGPRRQWLEKRNHKDKDSRFSKYVPIRPGVLLGVNVCTYASPMEWMEKKNTQKTDKKRASLRFLHVAICGAETTNAAVQLSGVDHAGLLHGSDTLLSHVQELLLQT